MQCKLCGSTDVKNLQKEVRGSTLAQVQYCAACDYAFLTDIDMDDDFYRQEFDTFMAERAKDDSWVDAQEHYAQRMEDAYERLDYLESIVDFSGVKKVLELGSSSGFVLKALSERHPHLTLCGVEPSDRHREYSKTLGLDAHATLESIEEEDFDLILSYFVLEHILEPVPWLASLKQKTRSGAKAVMIVPNLNEVLVSVYKDMNYDKFVWQLPHVSYFSENSLKKTLQALGSEVEVKHYQRYTLSNHLNWLSALKPRQSLEYDHITDEINTAYKHSLEKHGLGDTLVGIATIEA